MYYQLFNDTKKYKFTDINHLDTLDNKSNIKLLDCSNNQLTQLPQLPKNLKYLYCSSNQLTELPLLPPNLKILDCIYNKLTQLPKLTSNLTNLSCSNNKLNGLPQLPSNLKYIYFNKNSKNLHKYIIHCKSLYKYKKYNKYRDIDTLNDLLNYIIKNYYYFRIIKYYEEL